MPALVLDGVTLEVDGRTIVGPVDLEVADGEVVALVGPSGSGKTALIRLIAGLEQPTAGRIWVGGRPIEHLPSRSRNVSMVREDLAIPRRRTARQGISFPLTVRGVSYQEVDARVLAESERLGLLDLLDQPTAQLSAGQQQAVQAARAVISRPHVLLLDEPLTRVDPHLRARLRLELQGLQREHAVTSMWVTGDHREAFAVGRRLAVLIDGRIRQFDDPMEVYRRPVDLGVAAFVGEPAMNLLDARVTAAAAGGFDLWVAPDVAWRSWTPLLEPFVGGYVTVGVQPSDLAVVDDGGGPPDGAVAAAVEGVEHTGSEVKLRCRLPDGRLIVALHQEWLRSGAEVTISPASGRLHLFDPVSGNALIHPVD